MSLTPTSTAIRSYYERRAALDAQGATSEMSARAAFQNLLEATAGAHGWTLVPEMRVESSARRIIPDGTLRDSLTLPRGYWEAKDTADDLNAEIDKKFARGYPRSNIIFEDTRRGVLIQNGQQRYDADLRQPHEVAALLNLFYAYTAPNIEGFEAAVARFRDDTPRLSEGLKARITEAHKGNKRFQAAFADFMELCRASLNPAIQRPEVDDMLIQHLLTERLMRTVFNNADFTRRNVIASAVEKVIDALTSADFNRDQFIGQLSYFYEAIESAARELTGFSEKQTFINSTYESFFKAYSIRVADTHGIVYTPQPIVDYMCAAVEEVLETQFGQKLGDEGVCIIDPCTGTGNFIVNLLGRIARQNPAALAEAYTKRLFANEVMLLPYYVASLNIERTFYELHHSYVPFEGLCFVDTLDLAEGEQARMAFMTEANTARVQRQKDAPITVIIGNPPYNVGQRSENDNNKNRAYEVMDERIRQTYVKDSTATLRNKLYDPYVKFFRWASDRLGQRDGIIAYVSNNSFVDAKAFDGMRKHLLQDFTTLYHLDLSGNARTNSERRRQEGGNVFFDAIRVSVGITIAVRHSSQTQRRIYYYRVPDYLTSEDKLGFLADMVREEGRHNALNTTPFLPIVPDNRHSWRIPEHADRFAGFMPIGSGDSKGNRLGAAGTIFQTFSLGVVTNRDAYIYNFDPESQIRTAEIFTEIYNRAVDTLKRPGFKGQTNSLIDIADKRIKWTRQTKNSLKTSRYSLFSELNLRISMYRPFCKRHMYFDDFWNEERYLQHLFFPVKSNESENRLICLTDKASGKPFMALITNSIVDLHLVGAGAGTQCFPFYVYDPDGSNRRENITDWALAQFRAHYQDDSITKWDIFYYVYGVLHQPAYRTTYADNLKRDLPRIPFLPHFTPVSQAGRRLAALHLDYETVEPYPLEFVWAKGKAASYRVEKKMTLSKDKSAVVVNPSLTLRGLPPEALQYTLGGRSAVEWVIDQYQVKTDTASGITSDPNLYSDDPRYIVDLLARVARVSVETVAITARL